MCGHGRQGWAAGVCLELVYARVWLQGSHVMRAHHPCVSS